MCWKSRIPFLWSNGTVGIDGELLNGCFNTKGVAQPLQEDPKRVFYLPPSSPWRVLVSSASPEPATKGPSAVKRGKSQIYSLWGEKYLLEGPAQ